MAQVWTTPKPDAESGKENEDRFRLSGYRPSEPMGVSLSAAVADGASGSLFSREWARELARGYCDMSRLSLPSTAFLKKAKRDWEQSIVSKELPWYLEARKAEGSQAAFLGVTCREDGTWDALAAGDCCLFQRRDGRLLLAFPLTRADDFSHHPALWATHAQPAQNAAAARRIAGDWEPGDSLYLMTDAAAHWFLREIEIKRDPWVWLDGIQSGKDFRQRVNLLRENGRLRGDDTTVLHLHFDDYRKESTQDGALADID